MTFDGDGYSVVTWIVSWDDALSDETDGRIYGTQWCCLVDPWTDVHWSESACASLDCGLFVGEQVLELVAADDDCCSYAMNCGGGPSVLCHPFEYDDDVD